MTTEEPIQPAECCEKCGGMAKFARGCRPDAFSRGLEMWTYDCT